MITGPLGFYSIFPVGLFNKGLDHLKKKKK
jgi:hypothetical protein